MGMSTRSPAGLRTVYYVIFFTIIFLQKIGVSYGTLGVTLSLPVLYSVLTWLAVTGRLSISPWRTVLFLLFLAAAVLSQMASTLPFSVLSLLFLVSIYLPFTLRWRISRPEWLGIMSVFQNMMVAAAGMVFVQILWQLCFHWSVLSINPYIPNAFAMRGFMYEAPLHWGQPFERPNGFFMLEPSFISAFTASALILEATAFRRVWRLVWYASALIASTGVTGLVITAVAIPFLLAKLPAGYTAGAVFLLLFAVVGAIVSGAAEPLIGRLSELGDVNSSGFGRLIAPIIQLGDVAANPYSLLTGAGAGNIELASSIESSAWPLVKIAIEYGFLTAFIFMAFVTVCCWGSPAPGLAAGLFTVFSFTGGYLLSPVMPLLILLLVALLRITPDPEVQPARDPQTHPAPYRGSAIA